MIRFYLVTALLLQVAAVGLVVGRNSETSKQRWCELASEGTVRTNAPTIAVSKAIDSLLCNHAKLVMADGAPTNPTLKIELNSDSYRPLGDSGPFGDAGVQLVGRVWSQRNSDGNHMTISTSVDPEGYTLIEIRSELNNESVRLAAELCRELSEHDVRLGAPN